MWDKQKPISDAQKEKIKGEERSSDYDI